MTPDYRIYLRPGVDLVTAEDVADWLTRRIHPEWTARAAARMLRARLDRERRQACRRAALDLWRAGVDMQAHAHGRTGRPRRYSVETLPRFAHLPGDENPPVLAHLLRALAFRAAARAK